MPGTPSPQPDAETVPASHRFRDRARELLGSGQPRELIRRELAKLRETELLRLMHEAAVLEASPFWREVALRRFIRQKGVEDGHNHTGNAHREAGDSQERTEHGPRGTEYGR